MIRSVDPNFPTSKHPQLLALRGIFLACGILAGTSPIPESFDPSYRQRNPSWEDGSVHVQLRCQEKAREEEVGVYGSVKLMR